MEPPADQLVQNQRSTEQARQGRGASVHDAIRRGLQQLIQKEAIEEAKTLALKLMQKSSIQMECSDEGMMREQIEDCLRVVISAAAGLPDIGTWALEMLGHDSTGGVCWKELSELAQA